MDITNEKLISLIDKLKEMIYKESFDIEEKQDIYETVNSYLNNDFQIDKNFIQYLFMGWYVYENLNLEKNYIVNNK